MGFWNSFGLGIGKAVGKAPPRPPLQLSSNPSLETVQLPGPSSPGTRSDAGEPADPDIIQSLARARAIIVQTTGPGSKLHPAAEQTLRALERAAKSGHPDTHHPESRHFLLSGNTASTMIPTIDRSPSKPAHLLWPFAAA